MRRAIVFTLFNRVGFFTETINSWKNVNHLSEYDIFFRVEPTDVKGQMIDLINDFAQATNHPVTIIENDHVYGCTYNNFHAVEETFLKGYDFVVLAEDDITVSADVLHYFNVLSIQYKDDPRILTISANNCVRTDLSEDQLFSFNQFNPWVWGTWRDKWNTYLVPTWDFDYVSGQADNTASGWDQNITLRVLKNNNLLCIYPGHSRSQHIGTHGVHMRPEYYDACVSKTFKPAFTEVEQYTEI